MTGSEMDHGRLPVRSVFRSIAAICFGLLCCAALAGTGGQAQAQGELQEPSGLPPVDLALVLAVDASGSIDPWEFQLQKQGIAGAITDPEVLGEIRGGGHGRIAIAYVEWGSPGMPANVLGWSLIGDAASARSFADRLLAAPRSHQTWNAIGDAVHLAAGMIAACPCRPTRRVIDLSGDNRDIRSLYPLPAARDAAVAQGITINGLAILNDVRRGPSGKPYLVEVYEQELIGGFGAFVMTAADRADFARALRQKLVLEISSR
jgi:uncharacterized protein DUF1194